MPESETESQSLDIKPFRQITADDLSKDTITRKVPLENIGILAVYKLEKIKPEEVPFISGGKIKDQSWKLSVELSRTTSLSESALKRLTIAVRLYPDHKTLISNLEDESGKRVFSKWKSANEDVKPIQGSQQQPLLMGNNLLKIQMLETGGFLK